MRNLIILLLCINCLPSFAQTKKIAFRSHSGNANQFHSALEDRTGDTEHSNFGVAPDPIVKTAQLDSVILLCDTAAIMVTSEYCRNRRTTKDQETRWRAGKDTVYRHPLFNSHLPLDSIRLILETQYHFRNSPDKVVFIGFEEPITMNRRKNEAVFAGFKSDHQDPMNNQFVIITSLIFGLALLGGGIAWKISNSRESARTVNPDETLLVGAGCEL